MTTPVTPVAGLVSQITTGGTAVIFDTGNPNGGFITNPVSNVDQGISPAAAENLYINPTGAPATLSANGTCFALAPGQTWTLIPGQTTATSVNAATSGHKFSGVRE
jgi:hypothetical protein